MDKYIFREFIISDIFANKFVDQLCNWIGHVKVNVDLTVQIFVDENAGEDHDDDEGEKTKGIFCQTFWRLFQFILLLTNWIQTLHSLPNNVLSIRNQQTHSSLQTCRVWKNDVFLQVNVWVVKSTKTSLLLFSSSVITRCTLSWLS